MGPQTFSVGGPDRNYFLLCGPQGLFQLLSSAVLGPKWPWTIYKQMGVALFNKTLWPLECKFYMILYIAMLFLFFTFHHSFKNINTILSSGADGEQVVDQTGWPLHRSGHNTSQRNCFHDGSCWCTYWREKDEKEGMGGREGGKGKKEKNMNIALTFTFGFT